MRQVQIQKSGRNAASVRPVLFDVAAMRAAARAAAQDNDSDDSRGDES